MERLKEEKGFEIGELGREILDEWYAERGPVAVASEREELKKVHSLQLPPQMAREEKSDEKIKREAIKTKVKGLLDLGGKRGLSYAIEKAKNSGDSFLLDVFHDVLAKDGNYKKILKE